LARPSRAGAAIRIFKASPWSPTISERAAAGCTQTRSSTPPGTSRKAFFASSPMAVRRCSAKGSLRGGWPPSGLSLGFPEFFRACSWYLSGALFTGLLGSSPRGYVGNDGNFFGQNEIAEGPRRALQDYRGSLGFFRFPKAVKVGNHVPAKPLRTPKLYPVLKEKAQKQKGPIIVAKTSVG